MSQLLTLLLIAVLSFIPAQVAYSNTVILPVTSPVELHSDNKKVAVTETQKLKESVKADSVFPLSNAMMIGVGTGAVVLLGVAVSMGGDSDGGGSAPVVPPTADQLVDPWHAEGNQPGSGRTYVGTYHLYSGGVIGYDLQVSTGEHLVGTGSWSINEYLLQIQTDHGSLYSGQFTPGAYTSIDMNATSQWILRLTR